MKQRQKVESKYPCNVKIGDIIDIRFFQGGGHDPNDAIDCQGYRVIAISGAWDDPTYIDSINMRDRAPKTPPHFNFTVVPARIPVGEERKTDRGWWNQFIATPHPKFMREVGGSGYLKIVGHAADAQTELF